MAKIFTQITVAAPTLPGAVLGAGGTLVAGTTYYYRIVSVRHYQGKVICLSVPTAEVSATPNPGNQTITVSWTAAANADAYIVQRTTVSGSYPPGTQGQMYFTFLGGAVNATALTNIVDNGGGNNLLFTHYNIDLAGGVNVIDVSSDAGDTITLYDIYAADVGGGWGMIDMMCPPNMKTLASTRFRDEIPYVLEGSLYIHDCTFQQRGMLYSFNGGVHFVEANTILLIGNSDYEYAPYILFFNFDTIRLTLDNTTWGGGYLPNVINLQCTTDSRVYDLMRRGILKSGNVAPYVVEHWDDGVKNGLYRGGRLGWGATNAMIVQTGTYEEIFFESMRNTAYVVPIVDATVRGHWRGLSHSQDNTIFIRPLTLENPSLAVNSDVTWGDIHGSLEIDGTYEAKGQTDNVPYYSVRKGAFAGRTLVMANTLELHVQDGAGVAMVGAVAVILDVNGYSDVFEDSTATLSIDVAVAAVNMTVSDGTQFSVNDVVRVETYAENMLVTNIAGNVLTITRAYQGTTARLLRNLGNPRVLKQVASLITDASGDIDLTEFLIGREIVQASAGAGYARGFEGDLVTAGDIVRNMRTPHTVIISKPGYPTRTIIYTMDRKREEIEKLGGAAPHGREYRRRRYPGEVSALYEYE